MNKMMRRTTLREIKQSLGRFLAILAICALGVGFFAGLKVTKSAMIRTVDNYIKDEKLFDLRMLSTIGFTEEDIEAFAKETGIETVEGSVTADVLIVGPSDNEIVVKAHSLSENVNGILVTSGRMPEKANECVVDSLVYTDAQLGDEIIIADSNTTEDKDLFTYDTYTIVGIGQSSYYLNFERGTTALGNGKVSGFVYLLPEGFSSEYYTEAFIKLPHDYTLYTQEYIDYIKQETTKWENICADRIQTRYEDLLADANQELDDARTELADKEAEATQELEDAKTTLEESEAQVKDGKAALAKAKAEAESMAAFMLPEQLEQANQTFAAKEQELADAQTSIDEGWEEYHTSQADFEEQIADAKAEIEDAQKEVDDIEEPDTYVLDRTTNIGYACFESDSNIVEGVANVFPIFFFLVAALVCITTMNRMVEEQRTQIGVLKALGYGEASIMGKYLFYSGSAAITGCISGFAIGTYLFPRVIWTAYGMMYKVRPLEYIFDVKMAAISIAVTLLCSMGATWFSCHYELNEVAASLMRPKSPKAGKRVLLEYVPFIWNRMKFLYKVSARNIFRYKKRFFMMIVGIGGCTALLVTGFGIKDSVSTVAIQQFEEIDIYDGSVNFEDAQDTKKETDFTRLAAEKETQYTYVSEQSIDIEYEGKVKSMNLVMLEEPAVCADYIDLHTINKEPIAYPGEDEAVINNKIADTYHIKVGDTITLRDEDMNEMQVQVSGICENFIYNYVYLDSHTYQKQMKKSPEYKTAFMLYSDKEEVHQTAAAFMNLSMITATTINADMKERFSSMMSSLDYVVLMVICCAAFLAFIVLYNLTNINITERIREIATIKVLGFFRGETAAYVFRENLVLTAIGALVGLVLGKWLHIFVLDQINVDMVSFDVHVRPISYVFSILLTFGFAWVVNLFMSGKLEKINMAESLKSVD